MNGVLFFFFSPPPSLRLVFDRHRQEKAKKKKIYNQTFLIFYEMWRTSVLGWCWTDRDDTDILYLMYIFITLTNAISIIHLLLALINIFVGIISQSQSSVWMAHSVSPIWSGVFVSSINRNDTIKCFLFHLVRLLWCHWNHVCSTKGSLCGNNHLLLEKKVFSYSLI